jgi:hypothetical protein
MRIISRVVFSGVLFVTALATLGGGQPQVIDFEDRPAGAIINAEYSSRGVIFAGAYLEGHPNAHSGNRILRSVPPGTEVFTAKPLQMRFTGPMSRVALFAGNLPGVTGNGTLMAFDANNALVGQDGPKPVPGNAFTASFEVRAPAPRIVRAEFHIADSAHVAIDDLTVEGTTAPLPTSAPAVAIANPVEAAVLDEGPVELRGTVTGASLLDTMTLRIRRGLPEGSTAPDSNNDVTLSGSGTTRTFSLPYNALVGPYTLTAIAKNAANLESTATVRFSVVPSAIRARFESSGGAGVFGSLRFGAHDGDCTLAVYENGLIAAPPTGTLVVMGRIFTKWLATREQGSFLSRLGCPTGEEREALAGARAQDFRRGRIYATTNATAYVPAVFRDAIEALGGEATTGVAVTDPTDSSGAMQTWLFQRFARLDLPGVEASTLEIRGSPAVLYVERVGDGIDGVGLTANGNTPTVYRTFPCDGNLGPCTVTRPEYDRPVVTQCNGMYPVGSPTEWQSLTGKYVHTPVTGWVHSSRLSCTDNPLTHDYQMTNNSSRCEVTDVFPSDWNVGIRPLAGFGSRTTPDQTYMEIEFEAYYAGYFFAGWGWPIAGDLVVTNGRWIMDCGHSPVKAEIHPPYLLSHSRMRKRPDGRLETLAEIWVNGHYPGSEILLDLWPPPRPSPDAFLTITKPVDAGAAAGMNLSMRTSYSGVHIRFTAPFREVPIDESGKMHWMTGRGYEGEWTIGWTVK